MGCEMRTHPSFISSRHYRSDFNSISKTTMWSFSKLVLLHTMPTLLRNFLMRHFHGAGLGGSDGSNGPHDLRTWPLDVYIWDIWSKSSILFVLTTFNTWNSESEKLLHLSLLMFLVECGRKRNTAQMSAEPSMEPTQNFDKHVEKNIWVVL
jgi:hypothetical protein